MGRLFWKIFFGFWLTLMAMAVAVGLVVHVIYSEARLQQMTELAADPRAEITVAALAAALQHGGPGAAKSLLEDWPGRRRPPVLVVDAEGRDLLERTVPPAALARAREELATSDRRPGLRRVTAPDGREHVLFVSTDWISPPRRHPAPPREALAWRLAIPLLASLLFSAGLAWYLTRPIRHLRAASRRLAEGALDTRVMPLMGRRRDEIADLGRDFDHMAARLQALVGAQKRLLYDVSHELRSPLARLRVAVGLARQQPQKMDTALARIEREAERLDELVGEVLTLSRLEASVSEVTNGYVDLTALLEAVVEDARFEAEASGCGIGLRTMPEVVVKGRAELLHRALENVIRNAVRHTAPGTPVDVSVERDDARVRVSVCDRGPGVPEADLDAIFQPFFRAADAPAAVRSGYGLGLTIARRAIEAHAGHIRAANRPEGGLCVIAELPLTAGFPSEQ